MTATKVRLTYSGLAPARADFLAYVLCHSWSDGAFYGVSYPIGRLIR